MKLVNNRTARNYLLTAYPQHTERSTHSRDLDRIHTPSIQKNSNFRLKYLASDNRTFRGLLAMYYSDKYT
jgi:hypothetical protein